MRVYRQRDVHLYSTHLYIKISKQMMQAICKTLSLLEGYMIGIYLTRKHGTANSVSVLWRILAQSNNGLFIFTSFTDKGKFHISHSY